MAKLKIRPIPVPRKGLDYTKAGWELQPGFCPNAENMWYHRGSFKKVTGYVNFGSGLPFTGEIVLAGAEFETFAGNNYLLAITDSDIYKYETSNTTWTSLSGSYSGDVDLPISFTEMNDKFIFTNNVDNIQKWTGTGNVTDLANATDYKCKVVRQFYNHLFLLNTTESGTAVPQRVRWSDVGDPEDWTTGDAGSNDLVDTPGWIMGADLLGDHLVIYKEDSIILCDWIGGTSIYSFVTKVTGTGLYAQNTLVNVKDRHFFLGTDNVYTYDGSNVSSSIGDNIRDELFSTIDAQYKDRCFAFKLDQYHQYWLCIPTSSAYPDMAWVYNWKDKSWFKRPLPATAAVLWKEQTLTNWDSIDATWDSLSISWDDKNFSEVYSALFLGTSDGYINKYDFASTNDDGSAIDGFFETPDYFKTEGQEERDRSVTPLWLRWLGLKFYAKGDGVTLHYSTDEGTTWTSIGTTTLTSSFAEYTVDLSTSADRLRFRFRNNTTSETFEIQSKYDLMYQEKVQ
ncbi:hypothetical protein LCGC14_0407150 [marine sediment metagenome]|uniref:Uncharacterized protein n=1 Tax=marine sediment metagenome TaxID=412755 RepID=A0A0F9SV39_9ZZZZ